MSELITEPIELPVQAKVTGEIEVICQGHPECENTVYLPFVRKPLHEVLAAFEETGGICRTCKKNNER